MCDRQRQTHFIFNLEQANMSRCIPIFVGIILVGQVAFITLNVSVTNMDHPDKVCQLRPCAYVIYQTSGDEINHITKPLQDMSSFSLQNPVARCALHLLPSPNFTSGSCHGVQVYDNHSRPISNFCMYFIEQLNETLLCDTQLVEKDECTEAMDCAKMRETYNWWVRLVSAVPLGMESFFVCTVVSWLIVMSYLVTIVARVQIIEGRLTSV
jgi:hypothetical protein